MEKSSGKYSSGNIPETEGPCGKELAKKTFVAVSVVEFT